MPRFLTRPDRLVIAGLLLILGPALSLGRWHVTREPIRTLARMEANRTTGDSVAYASTLYHASHAKAIRAARWTLRGYATHAVLGGALALGLALSSLSRRTA